MCRRKHLRVPAGSGSPWPPKREPTRTLSKRLGSSPSRGPQRLQAPPRRRWLIAAAACALVAIALIALLAWPRTIPVPSVVGMTFDDARAALAEAGFHQVSREPAADAGAEIAEEVGQQAPPAGTGAAGDATITLTMVRPIPSVIGMALQQARSALEDAGFRRITEEGAAAGAPNVVREVEEQAPAAGSKVVAGTAITLKLRARPAPPAPTPLPDQWIEFKHSGAYIAKFYMTWTENGDKQSWNSGEKTNGYSYKHHFDGNVRDIHINAQAKTGLVWQAWGTIWDLKLNAPPNKTYTAKGTTLNRSYSTSP
jgi:hypothetical protein